MSEITVKIDEVFATPLTEEEQAKQAKEQARQEALATIAQLEASQLRSIRELMFDTNNEYAKSKLAEIEAKIQEARAKL